MCEVSFWGSSGFSVGSNLNDLWPLNLSQEESKSLCISCTVPGGFWSKMVKTQFLTSKVPWSKQSCCLSPYDFPFPACCALLPLSCGRDPLPTPTHPWFMVQQVQLHMWILLGKLLCLFFTTFLLKEPRRKSPCWVRRYINGSCCVSLKRLSLFWACLQCPMLVFWASWLFSSTEWASCSPRMLCQSFIF